MPTIGSESFRFVRDFIYDITQNHPNSQNRAVINSRRYVEIDQRPFANSKLQFAYGDSGDETAGSIIVIEKRPITVRRVTVGRISLIGELGWDVYDLTAEGTIDIFGSPSKTSTPELEKTLADKEIDNLAQWLENKRPVLWHI